MSKRTTALPRREIIAHTRLPGAAEEEIRRYGFFAIADVSNGARDVYATAPIRRHKCWCLSHIYSGNGRGYLEDRGYFKLNQGCVVLIAPGVGNITANDNSPDYREDFVLFGGSIFDQMQSIGLISTGCFWLGTQRRLTLIAELLRDVTVSSRWRAGIELQRLLLELVRRQTENRDNPIEALMEAIKANPKHWWSISEMAEYCRLSEAQTRRLLMQRTGLTPKPYAEGIKLRRAAEELIGTTRRIDEIATDFGYRDRFHFSRRFTAILGVPPAKYREQLAR